MKIEQTLALSEEILEVLASHYVKSRGIRVKTVLSTVMSIIVTLLGLSFFLLPDYITGVIFTLIGVCLIFFSAFGYKKLLVRNLKKVNEVLLGKESTVILTDDSINLNSFLGSSEYQWTAVKEIWQNEKYFAVVYVNNMTSLLLKEKLDENQKQWLKGKMNEIANAQKRKKHS